MLSSLESTAQPRQVPHVEPRCDLVALNVAYVKKINEERRKVDPTAPTATFDKVLLVGTVLHTKRMAVLDSLFHDADNHVAELVGTLVDGDPVDPGKLARHIFAKLQASKAGHCEIQESGERSFISVAASKGFYTVRLARVPGGGVSQQSRAHPSR